jgi:hypothetical protein
VLEELVSKKNQAAAFSLLTFAGGPDIISPGYGQEVIMKDYSYTLPVVITLSRALTLQVVNQGSEAHEMNLVKLDTGAGVQDVLSFLQSPSGSPPFEEVGGMSAIVAGGSGWIKIHLEPGTYAVLSFLPDQKSGKPQYVLGMITTFTVR